MRRCGRSARTSSRRERREGQEWRVEPRRSSHVMPAPVQAVVANPPGAQVKQPRDTRTHWVVETIFTAAPAEFPSKSFASVKAVLNQSAWGMLGHGSVQQITENKAPQRGLSGDSVDGQE